MGDGETVPLMSGAVCVLRGVRGVLRFADDLLANWEARRRFLGVGVLSGFDGVRDEDLWLSDFCGDGFADADFDLSFGIMWFWDWLVQGLDDG